MKVIAIANQKGGVGKTTTVLNLGHALMMFGKKVLMIDIDPQAHLTKCFGKECSFADSVGSVLLGENDIDASDNMMSLVMSCHEIANVSARLDPVSGVFALSRALKKMGNKYDYVLIDCPPNLSLLTYNALVASSNILIPVTAEYLPINGLAQMVMAVENLKDYNVSTEILGVLAVRYSDRKRLNREAVRMVKDSGLYLFKKTIRESIKIAEAQGHHKTIFEYAPDCNGAFDYKQFAHEFIKKVEDGQ